MFRSTFQSGLLSIFYSLGNKPLQLWCGETQAGSVKIVEDEDLHSDALELLAINISAVSITCPADPQLTLGIKMPNLVLVVKNVKKYFAFEAEVLDNKGTVRRFRVNNFQSNTRTKPSICTIPLRLDNGWNSVCFNLADFTKRAYGTTYVETLRVTVHANCRLRRVYFSDRVYAEDELPTEFKLSIPVGNKS